jgi:uncharacterized membrane protein YbhN (UPF0104 family)
MPLHHSERAALVFLLRHLLVGAAAGTAFGLLLLWQDWGGLYTLIRTAETAWLWFAMLFFALILTFGGVGMGIGVMSLGEDEH